MPRKAVLGPFHTTCQSKEITGSVMVSHLLKQSETFQGFVGTSNKRVLKMENDLIGIVVCAFLFWQEDVFQLT